MKKYITFIIAAVLVFGLVQCKKNETPATPDTPDDNIHWVRITLSVGGGGRDMDTVYPGTGAVVYQKGDIIYVGNNGLYRGKLEYQNGTFSGLVADPETDDYLHFYYLGKLTPNPAPRINETTDFTVSIADQTSELNVLSYGHSTTKYIDDYTAYTCMLMNKCGLVKFMAWPTPSTTNETVTISGVKTTAVISFDAETPGITSADGTGAVTLHKVDGSDPAERWAILLPQDKTNATISYKDKDGDDVAQTISLPRIKANAFYGGYNGISVGLEYVDLGLLSGRKWAACNVGSCTHEGFGTFFAWAETAPKSTYCWHSYKYAFNPKYYPENPSSAAIPNSDDSLHHEPGSNGLPNLGFFKYNTKKAYFAYEGGAVTGPNGVVEGPDGVSSIYVPTYDDSNLPIDDAAYVNWGEDWRIPTAQEWRDLINETTKTREVVNGVGGVRFTGTAEGYTDKSIFLPFAGVYGGPMHSFYYGCGNQPHGEYWSNEIDTIRPYQAYILYFDDKDHTQDPGTFPNGVVGGQIVFHNSGGDDVIEFIRNQGRPVRAVYDPDLNK